MAVCRYKRVEDALHTAGVLTQPRRQQTHGLVIELQAGGDDLLLEPAGAFARTRRRHGVDNVTPSRLHTVGQRLRQPPAAANQYEFGAGQRITEIRNKGCDVVGTETADSTSDHNAHFREERGSLRRIDDRVNLVFLVVELVDHQRAVSFADEAVHDLGDGGEHQ